MTTPTLPAGFIRLTAASGAPVYIRASAINGIMQMQYGAGSLVYLGIWCEVTEPSDAVLAAMAVAS